MSDPLQPPVKSAPKILNDLGNDLDRVFKAILDRYYVSSAAIPITGWIEKTDTWTRTGDHTFTISGDVTAIYRKGAKIRYKDGGSFEYGVIGSSSYSSPNTTINLIPNSDYAMAAATITDKAVSYISDPESFPTAFNYAGSWTAVTTNPTIGDGIITAKWIPVGHSTILVKFRVVMGSTTTYGSGNYNFSIPIASTNVYTSVAIETAAGQYLDASAGFRYSCVAYVRSGDMRATNYSGQIFNPAAPVTWANGDQISLSCTYEY